MFPLDYAWADTSWSYPFTALSSNSRGFGYDSEGEWHNGIDFTPGNGTPVHAIAAGSVAVAGWRSDFGYHVVIDHRPALAMCSVYGHMQAGSLTGESSVAPGEQLGLVGSTGNSSGPHLHLALSTSGYYGGYIDPALAPALIHTRPLAGTTNPPQAEEQDMATDLIYYAASGNYTTVASTTASGAVHPGGTAVVYRSMWYQECVGAPLFPLSNGVTYEGSPMAKEYVAFAGSRTKTTGWACDCTAQELGKLIEMRGTTTRPIGNFL